MDYDVDKVDDAVLALLWLTAHDIDEHGARSWKGHDWEVMNRLHEKGMIGDPVSKAKSVVLTKEGLARSRELFARLFGAEQVLRSVHDVHSPHRFRRNAREDASDAI